MYIGNDLQVAHPSYKIIDDISSGFNGSTTSFALQVGGEAPVPFPISTQQLTISVNGVIQEPDPTGSAGFKILGSNIVFSSAPANGHAFFGVINAGSDYVTAGSKFPDGSAAVPSFTFKDDVDTGWYRSASGAVNFSSNGVNKVLFDGNGITVTGTCTATSFAGAATQVTVADESSDTTCFPLFATAATGNLAPKSGSNLTFNSSSGALTATSFVGALTGNVTGNVSGSSGSCTGNTATATTATNVTVADESSDTTCYPLFATGPTGDLGAKSGSNLTFNSSSGALTATSFVGALTGNVTGNVSGSSGSCTGNASTASTLDTPRTIGGTSFDGSANITVDAATLDGIDSASFVRSDASDTLSGATYTISSTTNQKLILSGSTSPYLRFQTGTTNKGYIEWNNGNACIGIGNEGDGSQLRIKDNLDFTQNGSTFYTVWHAGNDGAGSGLDADLLDGHSGGSYLRSDATDTASSRISFTANATSNWDDMASSTGSMGSIEVYNSGSGNDAFMAFHSGSDFAFYFGLDADTNDLSVGGWSMGANKYKVWHAGNDGNGSGLDADMLDGVSSGSFLRGDTADIAAQDITFQGGAGAVSIDSNSDIRFANGTWTGNTYGKIQHHSNNLYVCGGTDGIIFREDGTNRWNINGDGHFLPGADSTYNIGSTSTRVAHGYFDNVDDAKGNLRSIPNNHTTSAYTLVASDAGKCVTNTSGGVNLPYNVFSAGDAITIINHSGSNITLTQGANNTMYNAADGATGNRTLAGRGMATAYYTANNICYISGAGLT